MSFAPNEAALFIEYDVISKEYPGWGLRDIKSMTRRERTYWLALLKWRRNQSGQ